MSAGQRLSILTIVVLCSVQCWCQDNETLNFPSYLQNDPNDPDDKWLFHTLLNGETIDIYFQDNNMTVISRHYGSMGDLLLKGECVYREGGIDEGEEIYYIEPYPSEIEAGLDISLCVIFHPRTENVVQFTSALLHHDNDTYMCDTMVQNDWPLIAYKPRTDQVYYHTCPLQQGGYNVKKTSTVSHPDVKKEYCEYEEFSGLIESECMLGEDLKLTFPAKNCIPIYTGWNEDHQLICLQTWEDRNFTFTVMGDEYYKPQYIMRTPVNFTSPGTIYLYQDLVSPQGDPANFTNYIIMEIHQKTNEPCKNDQMVDTCNITLCDRSLYRSTCQELCNFCEEDHPESVCSFDGDDNVMQGEWNFYGDRWDYDVTIGNESITMTTNYDHEFHAIDCHTKQESEIYSAYKMKARPAKGCLPRYSCARFNKVSPSVQRYQLSQGNMDSVSPDELCSDSNFQDDHPPFNNYIRSRHYNVLTAKDISKADSTVSCGFRGQYNISIALTGHPYECYGVMSDFDNCTGQHNVTINGTCDKDGGQAFQKEFDCLGVIDFGSASTKALITALDSSQVMCWLLIAGMNPLEFYAMNSAQCDASTLQDIQNKQRSYIAHVEADRVDTCDGTPTTDHTTVTTPSTQPGSTSSSVSSSTNTSPTDVTSDTPPDEGDPTGASAGKVIGIFFGVILGAVLIVASGWFVYRLYLARKQPYRVL